MRLWIFSFLLFAPATLLSQGLTRSDTLNPRADTSRVDSVFTGKDSVKSAADVDTVVNYSCTDSILYSFSTKVMSLYSKGEIKQKAMELRAERIDVNWNTSVMTAHGIPDTSDTTKKKITGAPVMKDGGEEYRGHELSYNFQTKKGKINVADTELDQGYYHGEDIKKVDQDVLFVADGRYTTCNKSDPDFYFYSPKMKVTMQDNVIAEPVYLVIDEVPVFWFPFAVLPNKGGRRSGIIAPAYGDDGLRGKFLSHLGYYFALSDYMDLRFRTDLYSKGGWAAYSDYRYALRYVFNGSVSAEYKRLHSGEQLDPARTEDESYRLGLLHQQVIDPTTHLDVNFTFASQNSYRNTIDLNQALEQSIISNATLAKSWEGTPNSISFNIARRQNLVDGSIDETLPGINFNHSQSYPFRRSKSSGGEEHLAWYEMVGLSYSAQIANSLAKTSRNIDSIRTTVNNNDTIYTVHDFERDHTQLLNQNIGVSIAPKFGNFTISPSATYSDQRSYITKDIPQRNSSDSSLGRSNVHSWQRAGFFSTGVSTSTKFYGIFQPGVFGIAAFRHTVSPNLSFTYSKQIIGENLPPKSMTLALNVSNIFEMKTIPAEEGKEGTKIQLLNLDGGIGYNFAADSLNFSPLSVSYRTAIGNSLNISGGADFDLYKLNQVSPGVYERINKFLINEEGRLARLTNFNVSFSTSLSGEKKKGSEPKPQLDTAAANRQRSGYFGVNNEEEPDFSIPWSLGLSFDFSENKVPPFRTRSSNLRGRLEFNLTENWKFNASGGYDLINKEVVVPDIHITRDLHCWVMDFSWTPTGFYRHYQLEIRLKAPQLRDLKVTKQGSDRGIY